MVELIISPSDHLLFFFFWTWKAASPPFIDLPQVNLPSTTPVESARHNTLSQQALQFNYALCCWRRKKKKKSYFHTLALSYCHRIHSSYFMQSYDYHLLHTSPIFISLLLMLVYNSWGRLRNLFPWLMYPRQQRLYKLKIKQGISHSCYPFFKY